MEGPATVGRQGILKLAGRVLAAGHSDCLGAWPAQHPPTSVPHHRDSAARARQGPITRWSSPACSMGARGAAPSPVSPLTWAQAGQAGQWWAPL